MRLVRSTLLTIVFALALAACVLKPVQVSNIKSGQVAVWQDSRLTQSWTLDQVQLASLSRWFADRSYGWSHSIVPYGPHLVIALEHFDGSISSVDIFQTLVIVATQAGQLQQRFSSEEIALLRTQLGAPQ